MKKITSIALMAASFSLQAADVPHTFQSGQTASAQQVNENFSALGEAIDTNYDDIRITAGGVDRNTQAIIDLARETDEAFIKEIHVNTYFDSSPFNASNWVGSEVVSVTCPLDTLLVGGSVSCSAPENDLSTTNYGVVTYSGFAGSTIVGACVSDSFLASPSLHGPAVTVYAQCMQVGGFETVSKSLSVATPSQEALTIIENARQHMLDYTNRVNDKLMNEH